MDKRTFEKAQELMAKITGKKQAISMLDTMLNKWYDNSHTDITVNCRSGQHDMGLCIHHSDLPELRDALMKARDRLKLELHKHEDELTAL